MTDTPNLTGTDKQITWATAIRAAWIAEVAAIAEQGYRTMQQQEALDDPRYVAFRNGWDAEVTAILAEHTDASWWIDRRPVDLTEGPARADRKGKLSDLTTRVHRAAIAARDAAAR